MAGSGARIWWQFRVKLDAYLDIAEAEVKSFQKSLEELASYNECKSVFSSLMSTYTKSNLDAAYKMPYMPYATESMLSLTFLDNARRERRR